MRPDGGPRSRLFDDGPARAVTFDIEGHRMVVTPTGDRAIHSDRRRFRVVCNSCGETVHEGTTSATTRVLQHIEEDK
jgi:hypothetical protein